MTPNTVPASDGNTQADQKKTRARKPAKRRAAGRSHGTKRSAASRRRNGQGGSRGRNASTASRLMTKGKQAMDGAYEWAAQSGRAIPRVAARNMPNIPSQRSLQTMLEERPLMLGAIGLGVGAMIGMMLPHGMMSGNFTSRRRGNRSGRRR